MQIVLGIYIFVREKITSSIFLLDSVPTMQFDL